MKRLVESDLEKLLREPLPTKTRITYDKGFRGFAVRTTPGGSIAFVLRYVIGEDKKERLYTIGRYPEWRLDDARTEAHRLNLDIAKGIDPLAKKQQKALAIVHAGRTFQQLAKEYMEKVAVDFRPRTREEYQQMLDSVLLPRFATVPLAAIGREEVETLHRDLQATPYHANRARGLLSCLFAYAMTRYDNIPDPADPGTETKKYWVEFNPVTGTKRYKERKRKAWFPKDEKAALQKAIAAYPGKDAAHAIEILLLTGCRRGELLAAEWSEFDLTRGFWNRPAAKTKQGEDAELKLSPRTIELLKQMEREKGASSFLFPGSGKRASEHRRSLERAWLQISRAAGLLKPSAKKPGKLIPKWRLHDIRHNYASQLASTGEFSLLAIGKMMGHSNPQTTQRYAYLQPGSQERVASRSDDLLDV